MAEKEARPSSWDRFAEEHLSWPICHDHYQNPKTLNCLHSFCEMCLLNYHRNHADRIECPVCRSVCSIPRGGVSSLATDFKLVSMLESVKKEVGQTAPHCSKHTGKKCKVFCQACSDLLCLNCSVEANRHSEHNIDEVSKALVDEKRKLVERRLLEFEWSMEQVLAAMQTVATQEQKFESAWQSCRKMIEERAEEQIALVNAAKNRLLWELNETKTSRRAEIARYTAELSSMKASLQDTIDHSKDAIQTVNGYDFLQSYSTLAPELSLSNVFDVPDVETDLSFLEFQPTYVSIEDVDLGEVHEYEYDLDY